MVTVTTDESNTKLRHTWLPFRAFFTNISFCFIFLLLLNDLKIVHTKSPPKPTSNHDVSSEPHLEPEDLVSSDTVPKKSYMIDNFKTDDTEVVPVRIDQENPLSFIIPLGGKREGRNLYKIHNPHDKFISKFSYEGSVSGESKNMPIEFPTLSSEEVSFQYLNLSDNNSLLDYSVNRSVDTNATLYEDDTYTIVQGIMSVILGVLILVTVVGNVFVIAAILLERNLQNVANYLVMSLAVADLMVACLVMPLGAVYEISEGWILGPELCDMWTSSDVLCCTASILHLVAIAVDRYWAVTNIDYIHTRNGGRILGMIVVVWSVAVVVSLAPQFGWKDPDYLDRINNQQRCLISQDIGYQIFATFSTFYVPLLVILVLYWKIYQTARKRIRRRRAQRNAVLESCKRVVTTPEKPPSRGMNFLSRKRFLRMKSRDKKSTSEGLVASLVLIEGQSTCSTVDVVEDDNTSRRASNTDMVEATTAFTITANHAITPSNLSPEKSSDITATTNNGSASTEPSKPTPPNTKDTPSLPVPHVVHKSHPPKRDKVRDLEAKREKKAAKTLAIITGAFVVCWLPFFITALLMPLCENCYISPFFASFFLWLGYFNSTLNPVIYTIFSPEFRMAFKRMLCGVNHARYRGRKLR